jgi:hypothetical protein
MSINIVLEAPPTDKCSNLTSRIWDAQASLGTLSSLLCNESTHKATTTKYQSFKIWFGG